MDQKQCEEAVAEVFQNLVLSEETNQSTVSSSETNLRCDSKKPVIDRTHKEDYEMAQETEIFDLIKLMGYEGPLLDFKQYKKALEGGPKSIDFTQMISFLVKEMKAVSSIDEDVNPISTPDDSITFIMEVSSLLNELGCAYKFLMTGHVSDRLNNVPHRLLLIDYLISQLMAARMISQEEPKNKIELKLKETSQASDIEKILQTIGLSKPPANITMQGLMHKINQTVEGLVKKAPQLVGKPLLSESLSVGEWEDLGKIQQETHEDYTTRREMLLKRLDCTVQSFQWSEKSKGKDEAFNKVFYEKRQLLTSEPDVDLSDLIAAREDLAIIEKTSSVSVRKNTKSSINQVIIGQVPDRGGRTSELAPPPPEMPPWQQRSAGPSGGGGNQRGGFKRGNSNFSRGGGQQQSRGGHSQSRGSFDSAGSYGQERRGSYNSGESRGNQSASYSHGNSRTYSQGNGGNYKQGNSGNYNQGNSGNYNQGNSGNYNQGSSGNYNQGNGGNYNQGNSGSYNQGSGGSYNQGSSGNYSQGSSGNYSQGNFDSAGSYGSGSSHGYQEPKRVKTYDQFQQNKTTYADQYVQESHHNQQYQPRDEYRGRGGRGGRSNYNRGGYR